MIHNAERGNNVNDQELETRAAEAQARIAAARAKQAAREKPKAQREVEELEREAEHLEAIEAAVAEHGEIDDGIKIVRYEDGGKPGIVIVRRPETIAVRRFHDQVARGNGVTLEAKDKFGRPFVVYPSPAKYADLTTKSAGLIMAVADAVGWLGHIGRAKLDEKS